MTMPTPEKEAFLRIEEEGPGSLKDHLWLYLYREGVAKVPWHWQFELLARAMGRPIVKLLSSFGL